MLIAPTQSATPMPRQVNRRIYFHTIIAASKALQFTVAMRARSWVGSGQVALRIPLHSGYAASGHMVQLKRSHPGINKGTFVGMGRKGPNVRFGSLADMTTSQGDVRFTPKSGHQSAGHECLPCSADMVPHSITSSARASSDGGIVSLSALAVLTVSTNSNLVDRVTSGSAGLSPLRIRPA